MSHLLVSTFADCAPGCMSVMRGQLRPGDAAKNSQTMACITSPCSSHISHCVKRDVGPTASLVHHHTSTSGFASAPCSSSKALKQTATQSPCKPDNNHCLVWYPIVHSRRCTTVHSCGPTSTPCFRAPIAQTGWPLAQALLLLIGHTKRVATQHHANQLAVSSGCYSTEIVLSGAGLGVSLSYQTALECLSTPSTLQGKAK
mgnify:CR=1 FL=1